MKPNEKLMERLPPIPEHLAIDLRQIANNLDTKAGYETLDAQQIRDAANLIESLTPRPIEEALKGEMILVDSVIARYKYTTAWWNEHNNIWSRNDGSLTITDRLNQPTHFIHLSAIQALMESGE